MKYAKKYAPLRSTSVGTAMADAEVVVTRLMSAQTEEDIRSALALFATKAGLRMTGHISLVSDAPRHFSFDEKMDPYIADYLGQGLVKVDPVLWRGQREVLPIPWGFREHRANMAKEERRLYSLLDDHRYNLGLLVPIHGPGGFSALGVAVNEDEASFRGRLHEFATFAHLVSFYLYDAVRRVSGASERPPPPSLTPRERECLVWVTAGKTAWEIARILSVAEATVIFHVENAKRKLGARTLPQAVARAVSLDLIKP